jgi:hypothetical protein
LHWSAQFQGIDTSGIRQSIAVEHPHGHCGFERSIIQERLRLIASGEGVV